jgi:hypothetical protein
VIAPPADRITIWAAQLAANDFPPVCAMTGRPAETWRRFRFGNPPDWLVIGLMGIVGAGMISRRISGYLPLTKSARDQLASVEATFALLPLALLLEIASYWLGRSFPTDADLSSLAHTLMVLGLVAIPLFVGGVILRYFFGPAAKVMGPPPGYSDNLVELRKVHPSFVAAVNQQHAARLAQSTGAN